MVRLGVRGRANTDMFATGSSSFDPENFGMSQQASELSIAHWVKLGNLVILGNFPHDFVLKN